MAHDDNFKPLRQTEWCVQRSFLSQTELSSLQRDLDDVAKLSSNDSGMYAYRDGATGVPNSGHIVRVERFVERSAVLNETPLFDRLCRLASDWLGEQTVLFKDKINYRWPGTPGFGAHQDVAAGWLKYVSGVVSIGLFPDGSMPQTGGLECANVDGALGLVPCVAGQIPHERYIEMDRTALTLEPNDVLLLGGLAPHRSFQNNSSCCQRHIFLTFSPARDGDKREQYYKEKLASFNSANVDGSLAFRLFSYAEDEN